MKSYGEYCLELKRQIDSCKDGKTAYTEKQLQHMYENGKFLIKKVMEEISCSFLDLKIQHNCFQILFDNSAYVINDNKKISVKNCISEILNDWKSKEDEKGNIKIQFISRYFGNGYSTALIIPYD